MTKKENGVERRLGNKSRILFLLNWLKKNTDDERTVSSAHLRHLLEEQGMKATPATLRDDVAALREAGYDIETWEENGIATWYYCMDRDLTDTQVQILIDAVSSSQFITKEKSRQLIGQLTAMAGPSSREQLQPGIHVDDQLKAQNESILYTIGQIRKAMAQNRRIHFRHYEYTPDMKLVPKHNGYIYEVSPFATVWKQDRYYLIGWSEKHGGIARFRIDRMETPKILQKVRRPVPEDLRGADNSDRIFRMFDGPEEEVTLRFKPGMINHIVDKFGTKLQLSDKAGESIDVTVKVHLAPTFYAWIFQYVGEMTIVSPEHVRREYAEKLSRGLSELRL